MLRKWLVIVSLIACTGSVRAADMNAFGGTWERAVERSSGNGYTQTVVISHAKDLEKFEARILTDGKPSGYRYEARYDGKPYDLFDVVTGKKRGTVVIDASRPNVIALAFKDDGAPQPFLRFERWLSRDGKSYASVITNQAGAVTSVSIFEKVK